MSDEALVSNRQLQSHIDQKDDLINDQVERIERLESQLKEREAEIERKNSALANMSGIASAKESRYTTLQEAARAVFEWSVEDRGGRNRGPDAPGHRHRVAGVWDRDNGDLANRPCEWCAAWNRLRQLIPTTDPEEE